MKIAWMGLHTHMHIHAHYTHKCTCMQTHTHVHMHAYMHTTHAHSHTCSQNIKNIHQGTRLHNNGCNFAGMLYAVGGHDGNEHLNSGEVFSPKTNKWKPISPMGTLRSVPTSTAGQCFRPMAA